MTLDMDKMIAARHYVAEHIKDIAKEWVASSGDMDEDTPTLKAAYAAVKAAKPPAVNSTWKELIIQELATAVTKSK